MALLFLTGGELGAKGDLFEDATDVQIQSSVVRNGDNAFQDNASTDGTFYVDLPSSNLDMWVGFGYRVSSIHSSNVDLMRFQAGASIMAKLRQTATTGELKAIRGDETELGASGQNVATGTWQYIECRILVNETTGQFEIKYNGTQVLNLTNQNTGPTAIDRIQFQFEAASDTIDYYWDDIYVLDDTGSVNTDFLGSSVQVSAIVPNADTADADWSPLGAGDNYVEVDEEVNDGDTSYNSSSTATDKDLFDCTNLPAAATVHGLQVLWVAKKDSAGSRSVNRILKSGTTENDGTVQALNTSYTAYKEIVETDPDTSAQWTDTGVNAVQLGYELAV